MHKEFDGMGREQLERLAKTYLDNLSSVQARCTELLLQVRAEKSAAMINVATERVRQDEKWGTIEKHLAVPNGTGDIAREIDREIAKRVCQQREIDGTLCWLDILYEEFCEAAAESDTVRLRSELVQVAATAVKWIEILDLRSKKNLQSKQEQTHYHDAGCLRYGCTGPFLTNKRAHVWEPSDRGTCCKACGIHKDQTSIGGLVAPSAADVCPGPF